MATTMQTRVFISYSRHDVEWKERIVTQLGVLESEGLIDTWHDGLIRPGADWLPAIEAAMASARVAVLIVSAHFLSSEFIRHHEIPVLFARRAEQGLRVIPVIVRPCGWDLVPWLNAMQALPGEGKSLAELGAPKADKVLSNLAREISALVGGAPPPPPLEPTPTAPAQAARSAPPPAETVQAARLATQEASSRLVVRRRTLRIWTASLALLVVVGVALALSRSVWPVRELGVYLRVPVRAHSTLTAPMLESVEGKAQNGYGPGPDDLPQVVGSCIAVDLKKGHRLVIGDFETCEQK